MARIPFELPEFDEDDLEEFVARFLNSGISLSVDGPDGVEERKILRAYRSNKTGGASDGGVDVVAKVEGGETWGFQCKLKTRGQKGRWTLSLSNSVVTEATYPAARYFLIVIAPNGCQREAIDFIEKRIDWEFWDADVLSSQFLTRVTFERGIPILKEFFAEDVADSCYGILQDEVLISAERFFKAYTNGELAFNHLTKLVGRRALVESLHQFVGDSPHKVMLLAARGGEGKSRVLREFSLEFESRHPGRELRFVNPHAGEGAAIALGYLLKKGLVVVHEDAHRTETLRSPVLAAIAEDENAKLILTVRPQGVEAVRRVLREHGLGADVVEALPTVTSLIATDMLELAKEVLGPAPRIEPHVLADWSDHSPLICVVGGNLIRLRKLPSNRFGNSETFRQEVFDRFEQQNLDSICRNDLSRSELLKRLLRTLAVLAPFPAKRETEQRLAGFLDIRGSQLEERLAELVAAEIVSKTSDGWRVRPDLFADHLVYASCVKDGQSSALCNELIETFGAEHFAAMLRNLSEAEWRARAEIQDGADLTAPLWDRFQQKFEDSTFWERRRLLEAWSTFSVFLPEKSIELAKLAIVRNQAPEDSSLLSSLDVASHLGVVEMVPNILKPIGIYHLDKQFEVFDILARLGRNWTTSRQSGTPDSGSHPWEVIGKAATFALGQPNGVLRWLRSRLEEDWFSELADQRCGFLSLILKPVFHRVVERVYSVGMQFVFETRALSVEKTAPIRDSAFELIEKRILPRSEIAALNVIPVLSSSVSFWGVGGDTKADRIEWRPIRLQGIELLKTSFQRWDSPFVRFLVWNALARWIPHEKDAVVAGAAKGTVDQIPRDLQLSIAFATLGTESVIHPDDDLGLAPDHRNSWERWDRYQSKVAAELLDQFPGAEALLAELASFDRDARARGFEPNWSPLVAAIAKSSAAIGRQFVNHSLDDQDSFLCGYVGVVGDATPNASAAEKDQWLAKAITSRNRDLRTSALGTFRWRSEPPGDLTTEAWSSLLLSACGEDRRDAVLALCSALAIGSNWTLQLLPRIPVGALDDATFASLVDSLVRAVQFAGIEVDISLLRPLLERLGYVNDISCDSYRGFLSIISNIAPRETYEFVRNRIQRWEAMDGRNRGPLFQPLPYAFEPWAILGLEKEEDFTEIAGFLTRQIRKSAPPGSRLWSDLFRAAVMTNDSTLAMEILRDWLWETDDVEELLKIIRIFNAPGSLRVFQESGFVKELLQKAVGYPPDDEKRIRTGLVPDCPFRGYSNGQLDPKYDYLLEEARKAASAHAGDPILRHFYDFVIQLELQDREWHRETYQNQMLNG